MGPVIPNVTPRALAALVPDAVVLAAVPMALPVALPLAVEDVVVALTPDLVTAAKVCDWVIMPEFKSMFPMKLI